MKQEKYFSKIDEKIVLKENTTIAITGATGSIGKSIATFFSNREVNLLLIGRNKKKLENLSSSLSNRKAHIETYCLDISSITDVKASLSYLKDKNIDIFYNNAGVFRKYVTAPMKSQRTMISIMTFKVEISIAESKDTAS